MQDYIETGHMSEVDPTTDGHYLPHHGVVKMTSTTTKVRPVFNASFPSETGISLNDLLCVGPMVQPESFDILMRFREKEFVIMGDITKMYRQVWIHPSQRHLLRILWRPNQSSAIKHHELNTITFGTAPASFLATQTVNHIANQNEKRFPQATEIMKNSFYVDDLVFGVKSIEEGIKLRDEIRPLLMEAGMTLSKFSSNSSLLLQGLSENLLDSVDNSEVRVIKTLGIVYSAKDDNFSYNLKSPREGKITKTTVLSEIASIYDPLGWIGPVVLAGKLIMKEVWLHKIDWKEELPDDIKERWIAFRQHLDSINQLRIPRHCFTINQSEIIIHGFADASIVGYGAVVYAFSKDNEGEQKVSILCAKSRVAPTNQKTLARLELNAAVLVSKLVVRVESILTVKANEVILWSDSTIVLNWISMEPARLSTYVGNRSAVVQDLTLANSLGDT